jgi:hypothetical protein
MSSATAFVQVRFSLYDSFELRQSYKLFAYIILGGKRSIQELPSGEQYTYDYDRFGCPLNYQYLQTFTPQLELWDGDVYVEDVLVNFNLWEYNGRTDFSFTEYAIDMGCTKAPSNWEIMKGKKPIDVLGKDCWGPESYESCFEDPPPNYNSGELNTIIYEILNGTSTNHLKFTGNNNDGIYLFQARVIDPYYSYCDLRVDFSIYMYGSPVTTVTKYAVFAAVVVIIISYTAATYVWFRYRFEKVDEDKDDKEKED